MYSVFDAASVIAICFVYPYLVTPANRRRNCQGGQDQYSGEAPLAEFGTIGMMS